MLDFYKRHSYYRKVDKFFLSSSIVKRLYMFIKSVSIKNYRTFENLQISFTEKHPIVIVGETQSGKSNLIHALRLLLDENLPRDFLEPTENDFFKIEDEILIEIELRSKVKHPLAALLHIIFKSTDDDSDTVTGSIRYHAKQMDNDIDFWYSWGKNIEVENKNKRLPYEIREAFRLGYLDALRDVTTELNNKFRSPLRYALHNLKPSDEHKKEFEDQSKNLNKLVQNVEGLSKVQISLIDNTKKLAGERHGLDYKFRAQGNDLITMLKDLKLSFVNHEKEFSLDESSLGSNNALYLALKALSFTHEDFKKKPSNNENKDITPYTCLAIEEPEAHLHPQLQRQIFKHFETQALDDLFNVIVSTHSPHLVSIAPIQNIVLLHRDLQTNTSQARQLNLSNFKSDELYKLQSYLQVTRAEMLFSSGVVLVEGIAEKLLIQAWYPSLDADGISVCSIEGTHFELYAKFLNDLAIPWVVITDGDFLEKEDSKEVYTTNPFLKKHCNNYKNFIFYNNKTLEFELIQTAGYQNFYFEKLQLLYKKAETIELHKGKLLCKETFKATWETISSYKPKDIEEENPFKKGMLSQELALKIQSQRSIYCVPKYINDAISRIQFMVGTINVSSD
jgi:putative ATP-dependent endonuclease of OLD family